MKKREIFVVIIIACCVSATSVLASGLKDLGVSDAAIAALSAQPQCAVIAQTGKKISFANAHGFKIARSGDTWMRFIAFKDSLPFQAQAIIIDGAGTVSRQIVDVNSCTIEKVAKTAVPSSVIVKKIQKVIPQREIVAEVAPVQYVASPVVQKSTTSSKNDGVHVRSVFDAIDTLNVSYAKYSPFGGEDNERHGKNLNIKARIRPLEIGNARVGVYGTYSNGQGETYKSSKNRWSYSDYTTYGGGFSGLYDHGDRLSSEFELGILWQDTDGKIPSKNFNSWQKENQWEARYKITSDARRQNGESWIPYWEIGTHYLHPFNVSYHDTNGNGDNYAYDNRKFNVWGLADVYDWYLGDNNQWRITPTLNAELGYLWGKDSGYIQGGPGTKIAWRGQEVFDLKFLNPRLMFEDNGSRIYDYIGTVKVDNLGRALWAGGVEDYRPSTK